MVIAINCSHSRLVPPRTPKNKAPASDPPPSVIALCSQPGPDNRTYAENVRPSAAACFNNSRSD